jgi:putative Ca2+/H+ antiporter (TMEM165/GDT1 family)
MLDFLGEFLLQLLADLLPDRYNRILILVVVMLVAVACFGVGGFFLCRAVSQEAERLLALPAILFAAFGFVCLTIARREKDPTEVGQKVGLSHNGVNRPTDKPGPQDRTAGQSRICRCIVESNVAEWATVHGAVRFLIS